MVGKPCLTYAGTCLLPKRDFLSGKGKIGKSRSFGSTRTCAVVEKVCILMGNVSYASPSPNFHMEKKYLALSSGL